MRDRLDEDLAAMLVALEPRIDGPAFRDACRRYFEGHRKPDELFNLLASDHVGRRVEAHNKLDPLLTALWHAHGWESETGRRVHKGTPYYFAGMSAIIAGDIDGGFLFMHAALDEDRRTSGTELPDWPALMFVTLDASRQSQAFADAVNRYAAIVDGHLGHYRASARGTLDLPTLRARGVQDARLTEPLFQLVHTIATLDHLDRTLTGLAPTPFAASVVGRALFDACLIADETLRQWFGPTTFLPLATSYCEATGVALSREDLRAANDAFLADFAAAMTKALEGDLRLRGRAIDDPREQDVVVTYGVRNQFAHGLAGERILLERTDQITHHILWMAFGTMERLPEA